MYCLCSLDNHNKKKFGFKPLYTITFFKHILTTSNTVMQYSNIKSIHICSGFKMHWVQSIPFSHICLAIQVNPSIIPNFGSVQSLKILLQNFQIHRSASILQRFQISCDPPQVNHSPQLITVQYQRKFLTHSNIKQGIQKNRALDCECTLLSCNFCKDYFAPRVSVCVFQHT